MFALRIDWVRTCFYLRRSFLTAAFLQKLRVPRRSTRSKELAIILGEDYSKQKGVLKMFSNKKERLYLLRVTEVRKLTAYNMMMKDRSHKLPVEDRTHYLMHKACEDYKNLSAAELKYYQEVADTMSIIRRKEYEEKLKMKPCPPSPLTPFIVMRKCRMTEVPREERYEYYHWTASKEYSNLSASDLLEYKKATEEINGLKIKVYEMSMERWKPREHKLIGE